MRRALVAMLALTTALGSLGGLVGCDSDTAGPHPAVQVVDDALEARASRSTNPADYSDYFADPEIAQRLVDSAIAEADAATAPTPAWETPELTAEGTSNVTVTVNWIPDDDHPGWPLTTEFVLQEIDGRWVIIDAVDVGLPPDEASDPTTSAP